MPEWNDDNQLFELARNELFTAVVGDVLDCMGLLHQFLPPQVKPLREDMIVIGRAMTVLEVDYFEQLNPDNENPALQRPFGLMLHALDDLRPNEVYVCNGGRADFACWGELMSTRAMKLGANGAVMHGYHRDTRGILAQNFPTFSIGAYAVDQAVRGKVIDFRCKLNIEGTTINNGDVIFGDLDGVCIVPADAVEEAFSRAIEKVRGEQLVRQAIQDGMSAADAFQKFGIM